MLVDTVLKSMAAVPQRGHDPREAGPPILAMPEPQGVCVALELDPKRSPEDTATCELFAISQAEGSYISIHKSGDQIWPPLCAHVHVILTLNKQDDTWGAIILHLKVF
jgi:hypothetical protein